MQELYYPLKEEFIEIASLNLHSSHDVPSQTHHLFDVTTEYSNSSIDAQVHLFPIYHELLADSLTPTMAFLNLRRYYEESGFNKAPFSYLFESVNVNEQTARFSYIGVVIPENNGTNGDISLNMNVLKFTVEKGQHDDPLKQVERMLGLYKYYEHPDLKGMFIGGAVGYVGFECVKCFEPRTINHQYNGGEKIKMKDELKDLPDAMFMLSDVVIIFDHLYSLMRVVGHAHLRKDMKICDIEFHYDETCKMIRAISSYLLSGSAPQMGLHETDTQNFNDEEASWEESMDQQAYMSCVQRLRQHIIDGDIVQCVPARRFTLKTKVHPFDVYRQLRTINPSPYMFYVDYVDFQLVGASPEMLVKVQDRIVYTHPIAGTRKRGETEEEDTRLADELISDEKERAEHIMLVDLGRNDVNRICKPETTKVDSLMHIERFSHVMHIVSHVSGSLREDKTEFDAFRSVFPAGTISGAPKVRALELILDNEPVKRGPYAGAVGYFAFNRIVDTCIGLRMMVFHKNKVFLQAGGGIVYNSDPLAEFMETEYKLRANMMTILRTEIQKYGRSSLGAYLKLPPDGLPKTKMMKPRAPTIHYSKDSKNVAYSSNEILAYFKAQMNFTKPPKVLLIDNYDSFTWNIYQYLCGLGADTTVLRNDAITIEECKQLSPDYLIISPGPGCPKDSGISCDTIRTFAGVIPILGVCLGEQCIYEVFGGVVSHAGEIVHGKTSWIKHDGKGIFAGVSPTLSATRYHSLAGDPTTLPADIIVTATTQNGIIMAIRHRDYVIEGVQFHPESVKTDEGVKIIANFLSMKGGHWIGEPGTITLNENRSILDCIVSRRRYDIALEKKGVNMDELIQEYLVKGQLPPSLNLYDKLLSHKSIALIAEIKRASPSKGSFDLDADASYLTEQYAKSGAVAISVLTEPRWFKGNLKDIVSARIATSSLHERPAIFMKDFIVDEYQILMGRISGADSCLLIAASLTDAELVRFLHFARSIQMEPLIEVNNSEEMSRALNAGAKIIGINNRNLHTFVVNPKITMELAAMVPSNVALVALSGITSCYDVKMYHQFTCKAVLVGESLMLAQDRVSFACGLLKHPIPLVKICGLTNLPDLLAARQRKANLLGLIFAPRSRRCLDWDTAKSILSAAELDHHHVQSPIKRELKSNSPAVHYHMYARELRLALERAARPLIVGIFADQPLDEVLDICRQVPLDLIQLHGNESREYAQKMPRPVIRAFSVSPATSSSMDSDFHLQAIKNLRDSIYKWADSCEYILLDTSQNNVTSGGTGLVCDWKIARAICSSYHHDQDVHFGLPIILAGGLNVQTISDAIQTVNPFCIDVCSGLEISPSSELSLPRKDYKKLDAFVRLVHGDNIKE
jgi:anthranilate synthase/indole-3-glycerol phosphate synthase/phosphoribosylanthranilate isomerase